MRRAAAVARKERSCQAKVKFSFTATFPVSSGRFVAVADCCPESPFFELAKEGTARSFEVWEGRTVFHNYPDEVALTQIPHKLVEQIGGRGVRKLENTELYDDTLYRPEHDRL